MLGYDDSENTSECIKVRFSCLSSMVTAVSISNESKFVFAINMVPTFLLVASDISTSLRPCCMPFILILLFVSVSIHCNTKSTYAGGEISVSYCLISFSSKPKPGITLFIKDSPSDIFQAKSSTNITPKEKISAFSSKSIPNMISGLI
eukprot:NODE_349_length_8994_cov_1.235526.p10 type:complete len:148 gc:universal NODE_349_length_8994_cov_1.235526:2353-2796(+)